MPSATTSPRGGMVEKRSDERTDAAAAAGTSTARGLSDGAREEGTATERRDQDPAALSFGGEIYVAYVADLFRLYEAYKESLERRSVSVVTSSSALSTLLFALVAFLNKSAEIAASPFAPWFLGTALACFASAGIAAIFVNMPRDYTGVKVEDVRAALREWRSTKQEAQRMVAHTQLNLIEAAKTQNGRKAKALALAIGFEAAAVGLLAGGLIAILAVRR